MERHWAEDETDPEEEDGWPFPYSSGPIRVDGGIRARSRRGSIGSTWWSRRFVDVLESLNIGGRMTRGRSYARSGQVLDLAVSAGSVTATVQGSRPRPYAVEIGLRVIWPKQWARVERALAGQARYSAKLLAGDMPQDLEQVFAELGLSLFPEGAGELTMECTCPDWAVPCKHVAATLYVLAEAFDTDPFLILSWRGREKADLLGNLRRLRGGSSSTVDSGQAEPARSAWDALEEVEQRPLAECVDTFFASPAPPRAALRAPGVVVPDAVLRERDPLPVQVRGRPVTDLLREAYLAMDPRRG